MENFNLKSMQHISEIEKIFVELDKNQRKRETNAVQLEDRKDSTEIDMLVLRIKDLENEVLRYKKYIKRLTKLENEGELAKIAKEKEKTIHKLKSEIMQRDEIIADIENDREKIYQKHQKEIDKFRRNNNELSKNFKRDMTLHKREFSLVVDKLKTELSSMNERIEIMLKEKEHFKKIIRELENEVKEKEHLQAMIDNFKEIENGYKKKLLDLQSNVQVYVRLKPRSVSFDKNHEKEHVKYTVNGNCLISKHSGKEYSFGFDRIFLPENNQDFVFDEMNTVIHGFLCGYNICIFAYGQTGSGKTYTMLGDRTSAGLVPRAIDNIYRELDGLTFSLDLKILEIYNEKVKDLITNVSVKGNEADWPSVPIHSKDEILRHITNSSRYRITEQTDCNETSSRSHSIYSLRLKVEKNKEQIEGTLNFIDLAGSERVKESHVEGQRLKETQNINKSLLNLRIVFNSLANKDKHVPYRDSKLTYILRNSLENKSKVIMLLNVSIDDKDFNETLCSLRFGQMTSTVCVGRGTRNITREID